MFAMRDWVKWTIVVIYHTGLRESYILVIQSGALITIWADGRLKKKMLGVLNISLISRWQCQTSPWITCGRSLVVRRGALLRRRWMVKRRLRRRREFRQTALHLLNLRQSRQNRNFSGWPTWTSCSPSSKSAAPAEGAAASAAALTKTMRRASFTPCSPSSAKSSLLQGYFSAQLSIFYDEYFVSLSTFKTYDVKHRGKFS